MACKSLQISSIIASAKCFWQPSPSLRLYDENIGMYGHLVKNHRTGKSQTLANTQLPFGLKRLINYGLELLKQIHINAYQCVKENHIFSSRNNELYPAMLLESTCEYFVENFVTDAGKFDDHAWVQKFVRDNNYGVNDRFVTGCRYALEDEVTKLWRLHDILGVDTDIRDPLVNFWIRKLSSSVDDEPDVWFDGFKIAVESAARIAAKYFWARLTGEQRARFLNDLNGISELICSMAQSERAGIVEFLMSLLSRDLQVLVLQRDFEENEFYSSIFWCFLQPTSETARSVEFLEMLEFRVPSGVMSSLLRDLARAYCGYGNAVYKDVLESVWGKCDKRDVVVDWAVGILLEGEEWELVRMILRDLNVDWVYEFLYWAGTDSYLGSGGKEMVKRKLWVLLLDKEEGWVRDDAFDLLIVVDGKSWEEKYDGDVRTAAGELWNEICEMSC